MIAILLLSLTLGVALAALWVAWEALAIARDVEQRVMHDDEIRTLVQTTLAERANADLVRQHVQQRTPVWSARPGSLRGN